MDNNQNQSPDDFYKKLKILLQQLLDKHCRPATEIILDDVDLRDMLKISRRTAFNYRQQYGLKFYKIENKIFYILQDVLDFLNAFGGQNGEAN